MDRPTSIQGYTYADLRRFHIERLQAEGKSSQQVRNHDSALRQFTTSVGKTDADECGNDLAERLDINLTLFSDFLTKKGVSGAWLANSISFIRAARVTFNTLVAGAVGVASFTESLHALLKTHGISVEHVVAETRISKKKFISWLSGSIPDKRSVHAIRRIERYFKLYPDALLGRIAFKGYNSKPPELKSRTDRSILLKDTYVYKTPTEALRAEWDELLRFRTAPYLVNGMRRNSTWRVKTPDSISREKLLSTWCAQTSNGVCVTACVAWENIARFFGYLLRDKTAGGAGMQENQLTLALLSDASLILGFIEFKRARVGVYTEEISRFFSFVCSFLRKDTGFLWQLPEYGSRLPTPVSNTEWYAWCEDNRSTLIRIGKELSSGKHFQKGRDPKEPIAHIIAQEHPIRTLVAMVEAMSKKFMLSQYSNLRVTHKRDVLLIKMLIANPLRVHHFCIMSYHKNDSGNLYQDASGAWRLRFKPEDFKNQRGAAGKEYDVLLSAWVYQDIEEYLEQHRPHLKYADISDRVFLPAYGAGREGHGFWSASAIHKRLLKITQEYIPNCPGFGPHAFRHIIATDYIKNNPNGFQVAANILHDRLSTVLKEYAHVKVADGFSHWTSYLDEQLKAVGGTKQ